MARINLQDDIESRGEFWRLLEIYKDRDLCLGKLVRFFRLAQHRYGYDQPLTRADLGAHGLEAMIDTGWAIPVSDHVFMALGAEKQFGWFRQKVHAGLKSKDKALEKREASKNNQVASTGDESRGNETLAPSLPLSLSPSLSPSKKKDSIGGSHNPAPGLESLADLFAARKISTELQLLWLESYSAEFILDKVRQLSIWEKTAGQKAKKSNWGRFYSNCFQKDWDHWVARKPSQPVRTAPGANAAAKIEHKAPETNWVTDLQKQGLFKESE